MSGGGGGGSGRVSGGGGGGVIGGIPPGSRKMVQNIKEIVNRPEAEIYATLKECNMDPSETVERLLAQDTFHEVKSKREKKKEIKDTPDSRSRAASSSSRGGRAGIDRGGRSTTSQYSSNDGGVSRGISTSKKENGPASVPTSSILGPAVHAPNLSRKLPVLNNPPAMESMSQATGIQDGVPLPSQPSVAPQQGWGGAPGQITMADIVKRGRPPSKPAIPVSAHEKPIMSNAPDTAFVAMPSQFPVLESNHAFKSSSNIIAKTADISHEKETSAEQDISHDSWSLAEDTLVGSGPGPEASVVLSKGEPSISDLLEGVDLHLKPNADDTSVQEGSSNGESVLEEPTGHTSINRQVNMDNSGDTHFVDGSFQSQRQAFDHHEVEDVNIGISSAALGIQQLNLNKEDISSSSVGEHPAVIIPDHLQVTNADCSHLSFGSFGSGVSASLPGSFPTKPIKANLDTTPAAEPSTLANQPETRTAEYYDNDQLRPTVSENADQIASSSISYDTPSLSQSEIPRNDSLDAMHDLQYNIPSVSGYSLQNTTQTNAASFAYAQANPQMQNLASFSSLLQPYNNPLPSNSVTSTLPQSRSFDLPFSTFLAMQSMPTKYSTSVSSISGTTLAVPEAAKQSAFTSAQASPQPSTSIPVGPALPQQLQVHPFSQPIPLGHYTNIMGYPFLPPSYTYMPSAAFQQTYTGNGAMHQSQATLQGAAIKYNLPQYKANASVTSLPQSAAVASGYGGFGGSNIIPGSYNLNPTPSASSSIDDALASQYKEAANQYILQQSDNPAMWVQGAGSRTMSPLPPSTFYSFLGQNQQSGFRQNQQLSALGNLGYPNIYHSQAGMSQEHQQNSGEGNLNGSQGAQTQQSHQMWQPSY